jgi:cytoskeletal protein CcmA (bactofilin family)
MAMKGFMAARAERVSEATKQPETTRPVPASAPAIRTVAPSTSVDATSEVEGRLRCKETLRIDGRVEGEVECEKTVLVGECAKVHASIAADEVQISGVVQGNIAARRKITLERTAVVTGDLTTPGIVIEEGAKLKGRIVIGSDEETLETEPARDAKKEEGKKGQAARKPQAASPKPDDVPAPQPAVAGA